MIAIIIIILILIRILILTLSLTRVRVDLLNNNITIIIIIINIVATIISIIPEYDISAAMLRVTNCVLYELSSYMQHSSRSATMYVCLWLHILLQKKREQN